MDVHNINVSGSQIGVLNTGHIGSIDTAVGVLQAVDPNAADGIKGFAEGVISSTEIDDTTKQTAMELLSVLATEATAPKESRRSSAMKAVLSELASLASGVAALSDLFDKYGSAIADLFS